MNNVEINFTLITDGSSDQALMNIIRWTLNNLYPKIAFNVFEADLKAKIDGFTVRKYA